MGKWTPGPWRAGCAIEPTRIQDASPTTVRAVESGRAVASTAVYLTNMDNGQHVVENEANARLIAKAPEMAAFVGRVRDAADEAWPDEHAADLLRELGREARALLADLERDE